MVRGRALQFDPKLIDLFGPMIARLRAEHADLDAFLGQAARQTALTVARQKIAESLARPIEAADDAGYSREPAYRSEIRLAFIRCQRRLRGPFKRTLHGEIFHALRVSDRYA